METPPIHSKRPLYWLALGAFSIATEAFMIAPLLPSIATDLSVSIGAAGLLVTVFAFAYAISTPVLTTLTGNLNRRTLLIASLAAFAVANMVAWAATGYYALMGARVLLAFSAGLYLPNANAVAGALVPPEQRGRALATVNGGSSLAVALGVPIGAVIGTAGSWRTTFASVALLGAIGTIGLQFGLPKNFGKNFPTATLRERLNVGRQPPVLAALLSTTLWAMGAYTVYTYIAAYMEATLGPHGIPLSVVLFAWGASAVTGMVLAGRFTDKWGPRRVIVLALGAMALAFASLSLIRAYVPPSHATVPVLMAIVVWGASGWGFVPPQQARLMAAGGIHVAPVALSLNASFMYLGFSLGAALGGFTLSRGSVVHLGGVGALLELASLAVLLSADRSKASEAPPSSSRPSRLTATGR